MSKKPLMKDMSTQDRNDWKYYQRLIFDLNYRTPPSQLLEHAEAEIERLTEKYPRENYIDSLLDRFGGLK